LTPTLATAFPFGSEATTLTMGTERVPAAVPAAICNTTVATAPEPMALALSKANTKNRAPPPVVKAAVEPMTLLLAAVAAEPAEADTKDNEVGKVTSNCNALIDVVPAVKLTVRVTSVPALPEPLPTLICGVPDGAEAVKVAVTVRFDVTETAQVPVPEHPPPDQPVNVEPEAGAAVKVMLVPDATVWLQVDPQLTEPPVTVPEPVPDLATVSV
jgi:hypothetical protein